MAVCSRISPGRFRGTLRVLEIEPRLAACKTNPLLSVLLLQHQLADELRAWITLLSQARSQYDLPFLPFWAISVFVHYASHLIITLKQWLLIFSNCLNMQQRAREIAQWGGTCLLSCTVNISLKLARSDP